MKQILFIILLGSSLSVSAQKIKAINISIFNESTSFPFTRFAPVHPGIEAGLTLHDRERDKSVRHFRLNAGYYYHKKLESAIYINGEYAFRPKIKDFMTIDFTSSIGYLHTFYPSEVYIINDNGDIEEHKQIGRPHFMAGIGLGVSFTKYRIQPFVRQEMNIATPFAYSIPLMVHSFIKIGITLKINQNEK